MKASDFGVFQRCSAFEDIQGERPATTMAEQQKTDQEKSLKVTALIPVPIPKTFLTTCAKRGGTLKALVNRYRRSSPGSLIQIATANHIAINLDDHLWVAYARLNGFDVEEAAGWIRLADYAVENGIRPWTALKAAKAGLIPDAHERYLGEWYVPVSCNWVPRPYRKQTD
jgi:hypothetical protein